MEPDPALPPDACAGLTHGASSRKYLWAVRAAWLILLVAVCVRVGISPQRQSVSAADYMPTGWHWIHGEEIYHAKHHFVYSPLVAAAFAPLSIFPAGLSNILWRVICVLALVWAATAWLRSGLSGLDGRPGAAASLPAVNVALLLLLPLSIGNVNNGQMNVLVLAVVTCGVLAVSRQWWNLAALLFAGAGYMKIYPLAIGLLLAVLYPRQLSWRLILAVAGLFLLSLVLQRPSYALTEYSHWFATLRGDGRLDTDLDASWRDFGYLLRAVGVPLSDRGYRVMEVASGGALAVFVWLGQRRWHWPDTRLQGAVFSLGCAWMVLFGPATEAATYVVVALPVCATLIAAWTLRAPQARSPLGALPGIIATAYALLLLADLANAWVAGGRHHLYLRALQPVAALLYVTGILWWLLQPDCTANPNPCTQPTS